MIPCQSSLFSDLINARLMLLPCVTKLKEKLELFRSYQKKPRAEFEKLIKEEENRLKELNVEVPQGSTLNDVIIAIESGVNFLNTRVTEIDQLFEDYFSVLKRRTLTIFPPQNLPELNLHTLNGAISNDGKPKEVPDIGNPQQPKLL